jgi:hypothetical protein
MTKISLAVAESLLNHQSLGSYEAYSFIKSPEMIKFWEDSVTTPCKTQARPHHIPYFACQPLPAPTGTPNPIAPLTLESPQAIEDYMICAAKAEYECFRNGKRQHRLRAKDKISTAGLISRTLPIGNGQNTTLDDIQTMVEMIVLEGKHKLVQEWRQLGLSQAGTVIDSWIAGAVVSLALIPPDFY